MKKFIDPWGREFENQEEAEKFLKNEMGANEDEMLDFLANDGNYWIGYGNLIFWIFRDEQMKAKFLADFKEELDDMINTRVADTIELGGVSLN